MLDQANNNDVLAAGDLGPRAPPGNPPSAPCAALPVRGELLTDDCIANRQAVSMGRRAVQVGPRSSLLEDCISIRFPIQSAYRSPQLTLANIKLREMAVSPWEIPDATTSVPNPRAVFHDFMPTKPARGSRRWPAAQPTLTASVLPLNALPSATTAHMDPPCSKCSARTLGACAPASDRAPQLTPADPTSCPINQPEEADIHKNDFQSDAYRDFMFGKQGGNDQAKTRGFDLVKWKEEGARLATIADVVSISFLMAIVVQSLAGWSWTFPSPESDLGRFQQEGILLSCA